MLDTLRRRRDGRAGRDNSYIEAKHIRRVGYALGISMLFVAASLTPDIMQKTKKIHNDTACEHIEG